MPISTFHFKLTSTGGGYAVALSVDSGDRATAPFLFNLDASSRLNQVVKSMVEGIVEYDDLRDVGTNLFTGLINGGVRDLYLKARRALEASAGGTSAPGDTQIMLRLDLPAELRTLPWECLYEEERAPGFLLNEPGYSLARDTPNLDIPGMVPRRTLPVRMLVVIPEGSNLNVEKELHGLDVAVGKLGDDISLSTLSGQVTPDRLRTRMDDGPWDIVHFIGHGQIVNGDALVRLNDENPENGDQWVNGEIFASFFQRSVPRLVVLNCCYGGSQASLRTLSGLGPFLLRAGVPAVVAMQYEIPDRVAIKFAETFYGELLTGRAPGRIDCALTAARLVLYQNQTKDRPQSFVTPVLYLVPGHEAILELSAIRPAPEPATAAAAPAIVATQIPQDLLDAFKDRRVVPVIGPDLFAVGAMRATAPPPGPHELARQLAEEAGYPRMEYFKLPDATAEGTGVWLLPAVCQHYERKKERWKLLMAVQKIYKEFPPPPAIEQIAGWNVPGIICAYFDGLLDASMAKQSRVFRTLHSVDEKAAGLHDETLVVHVRGVYSQDDSLVLTERDHELLLDRMMNLSSQVSDLARKSVGRSLLYLGVSPRDPLIRRLTRAVRGNGRNQGPMYFVIPDQTDEDAYWDDYDVRWLPMKLEDFMAAVADAGSGARS